MVFLLTLLVIGCRSGFEPSPNSVRGTWQWIGSTGGIAGMSYTPASVHYSVKFQFTDGKVTLFRNDSVKTTIDVATDSVVTLTPGITVFTFSQPIGPQRLRFLASDTISVADPCCDGFDHHFARTR